MGRVFMAVVSLGNYSSFSLPVGSPNLAIVPLHLLHDPVVCLLGFFHSVLDYNVTIGSYYTPPRVFIEGPFVIVAQSMPVGCGKSYFLFLDGLSSH